ncbi:MAG TPA: aldo/keto reductase, partial [Hyphomicrobiaceae bacterium]|nr:aldo/keto reductase [Hyphomicrobiaceae bacterium]
MKTRRFGRTGLAISEITYGGGWVGGYIIRAGEAERHTILNRALHAGINWVDTAALYGNGASETVLGQWLPTVPANRRPRLSTKFNVDVTAGDFKGQIEASVKASLARLKLPRVEVLILHNRVVDEGRKDRDPRSLHPAEVLGRGGIADIMDGLRRAGLCDWIGLTGLGDPAALAQVVGSGRFDVMQGYYNLLNPSGVMPTGPGWSSTDFNGLLKLARAKDVGVMGIRIFAAGH